MSPHCMSCRMLVTCLPYAAVELLMLLKWRQGERDLSVVLTNMLHIGGEEVVKFLQDTLDCLFEILSTNQEVHGEKIFEVLVRQEDMY